jgi:general stress protein YciG
MHAHFTDTATVKGVKMPNNKKDGDTKRGFASMDKDKRREIASKGGRESGSSFAHDRERAAEAGRKAGGDHRSQRSR